MRRIIFVIVMVAVLAPACDGDETTSEPTEVIELRAKNMRGRVEVPPGDPKAKGFVGVDLDKGEGQVCIEYGFDGLAEPTAMHIHEGEAGQAGDPVVDLPLHGGCVEADPSLIEDIADDPAAYYVNVHTEKYPDGAIRAQLEPE